jgi:signal transduction histidine kinase
VRPGRLLRTSSFRLALIYAAITGASFLVLFGVIFWSTARFMRHQIDDSVANEIDEILADSQAGNAGGLEGVVRGLARHPSGFYYLLQSADGVVMAGNMPSMDARAGVREWDEGHGPAGRSQPSVRGRGLEMQGRYLFVGWSTQQLHEMEHMVVGSFVWGLGASIALALVGGFVAAGRLMRKIEAVSETSRNIVQGDLTRRVPVTAAGDEFDHLAGSINAMLNRIESLMSDLHQVTTDIAHDMRTPLTRLRQRLEGAQRSSTGAEELRGLLGRTIREIDDILGIFSAVLRIAQIESGARKPGFTAVDLSELLGTVAELYRPGADEKHQTFHAEVAPGLTVRGDRELLMQLFANLTENAVRHSPPGAHIGLRAAAHAGAVEVAVADDGPGIPAEYRAKVLERFFRLERSRTTPGSGLGLSLANAVVKLHEAAMALADHEPGLEVTVTLPAAQPRAVRSPGDPPASPRVSPAGSG